MAEQTLSYKEPEKTELNADEQESLAIGEEMVQQQDTLLAGKYKNAEELEKAYKELESKLGSQEEVKTEAEPEKVEAKEEKKEEVERAFLESLWEESQAEGDFKKETLDQLKGMNPTDLAQEYLNYRAASEQPKSELTDKDIDSLYDIAGGKKGYSDMMAWAKSNLPPDEIKMFDNVVNQNDPNSAYFAVKSLHYRYSDTQGVDGQLLSGKAAPTAAPGFRSQQELVTAMSDPRYDKDPAYRQEVIQKLDRSTDLEF